MHCHRLRSKLQFKATTAADSVLQAVCKKQLGGWPARRCNLDKNLHGYCPLRHNINTQNDIGMAGDKIINSQSFRKVILEKLHLAHQGVQRTKAKETVEKCIQCQQYQPKQQKEPLITHEVPELPWMKVGADVLHLKGQSYLFLVDYLPKISGVTEFP